MAFRYVGLSPTHFAPLGVLGDDALAARGIRRMVVTEKPGFPCRVTLEDADPGERVLLLAFEHQPAHSPYRESGPIFVREDAHAVYDRVSEPPLSLSSRLLSARAYDAEGMMVHADVSLGDQIETLLGQFFGDERVAYVHLHYARRGCYAARVERADYFRLADKSA